MERRLPNNHGQPVPREIKPPVGEPEVNRIQAEGIRRNMRRITISGK